jgi:hypothetical protein
VTAPLVPIGGRYRAPKCKVGDSLECLLLARAVVVAGFSTAPVPWPFSSERVGQRNLILCGDLVRAVRTEAALVVTRIFGVSGNLVSLWRKRLNVNYPTGRSQARLDAAKAKPKKKKREPRAGSNPVGRPRTVNPDSIVARYRDGGRPSEIARGMNLTRQRVSQVLKAAGIDVRADKREAKSARLKLPAKPARKRQKRKS